MSGREDEEGAESSARSFASDYFRNTRKHGRIFQRIIRKVSAPSIVWHSVSGKWWCNISTFYRPLNIVKYTWCVVHVSTSNPRKSQQNHLNTGDTLGTQWSCVLRKHLIQFQVICIVFTRFLEVSLHRQWGLHRVAHVLSHCSTRILN